MFHTRQNLCAMMEVPILARSLTRKIVYQTHKHSLLNLVLAAAPRAIAAITSALPAVLGGAK